MGYRPYEYVFTETAEADLDEILTYIAEELSNPDAAESLADNLEEQLRELCNNPRAGRPVVNAYLKRDDVRRFLIGNYVAYYLVEDERVRIVVLRIVYGKRSQDRIVREF